MTEQKTIWQEQIRQICIQVIANMRNTDTSEDIANCILQRLTDEVVLTLPKKHQELSNKVERLESEVSRYKAALELARQEYKALVSSEIDSGKGELQIWMNHFDEIITLKPNKK